VKIIITEEMKEAGHRIASILYDAAIEIFIEDIENAID